MFATMRHEDALPEPPERLPPLSERATTERPHLDQQVAPSDTYPALGEPLAIEFANTLFTDGGRPLDALTTQAALTRWLDANAERIDAPLPRRLGAGDLERALELRAIIRALLATAVDGDPPAAATVRRLNELAALAPITARLHWTADEPPKARLSPSSAGRLAALLALLAQSAIDVLGGSGAGRLRRCEAPGCITYYLKDHPRRAWCSPKCGNRVRVARHYQRHRRTGS
jgi:predicted RNA-binding Zn ribbon-like protein